MLHRITNKKFIKVKVFVGVKKERVIKKAVDSFVIYTKEPAKQGRANKRVLEILAFYLKINPKSIRLIKGAK